MFTLVNQGLFLNDVHGTALFIPFLATYAPFSGGEIPTRISFEIWLFHLSLLATFDSKLDRRWKRLHNMMWKYQNGRRSCIEWSLSEPFSSIMPTDAAVSTHPSVVSRQKRYCRYSSPASPPRPKDLHTIDRLSQLHLRRLAQVCATWHGLVLNTPSLWSTIDVEFEFRDEEMEQKTEPIKASLG
ncbi:hypothetical protein C8R43DRAFT_492820 [Mycena crocata]|nr:hypothetical protein C8R43DRAFT_492820 [Mycena crocata]